MDAGHEDVGDVVAAAYCRRCGYSLRGLASGNCPECGGAFDLADRRTFDRRRPRVGARWWVWRLSLAVVVLGLAIGSVPGLYWWRWRAERLVIDEVGRLGGVAQVKRLEATGMAVWLPERWAHWRDRAWEVRLERLSAEQVGRVDLRPLERLEVLELSESSVGDEMLAQLRGMASLRWVYLQGNPLNGSGLANLAGSRLVILRLADTRVDDAGLANLKGMTSLRFLDVSGTAVTDAGMEALTGMTALNHLDLGRTAVTDVGLKKLSGLKSLRSVYVGGTKVTARGMREFQGSVPGVSFYQ